MKIDVKLDEKYKELMVWVMTNKVTPDVQELIDHIALADQKDIVGYQEFGFEFLKQPDIISVYSENQKVFARTEKGIYQIKQRLYQMEELLNPKDYIRISNSEIINLRWLQKFDLSLGGTVCLIFKDNTSTYVSRRYVKKVKNKLGL